MANKKPKKKVTTNEQSIQRAENALNIQYPHIIKEKIKAKNWFYGWEYRFFCVLDDDDKFHTFDDVVRENTIERTWRKHHIPAAYVAIAEDGMWWCLALNTNKDNIIYSISHGEVTIFAKDENTLSLTIEWHQKEDNNTIEATDHNQINKQQNINDITLIMYIFLWIACIIGLIWLIAQIMK